MFNHQIQPYQVRPAPYRSPQGPTYEQKTHYPPNQMEYQSAYEYYAKPNQAPSWPDITQDPQQSQQVQQAQYQIPPYQQMQTSQSQEVQNLNFMNQFKNEDGQMDMDKVLSTVGQLANTVQQVSPVIKQVSSIIKAFR